MGFVNDALSEEEYKILSCNKENWQKGQLQYTEFIEILKKYISLYGNNCMVYLEAISFPEVIFDKELIGNNGIHILNCNFYGKVIFKDLILEEEVIINHSEYWAEVVYKNITFNKKVTTWWNNYHKEVIFRDLIFNNEVNFDDVFYENVLFKSLEFLKETDFGSLILKKKCQILNISGAENLIWNELLCIYDSSEVYWDEREKYIDSIFQKQDSIDMENLTLVKEIKKAFPEIVLEINTYLEDTSNGWSCYFWIEAFADKTRGLLKGKHYKEAKRHLIFMNTQLSKENKKTKNLIDVGYVENLLYDLHYKERKEAWKYFPDGIKNSYTSFLGEP